MYVQGTIASRISLCVNIDVSIYPWRAVLKFLRYFLLLKKFFFYQKIYFLIWEIDFYILEIRILVISNNNGYFFIPKNLISKIRKIEYLISENHFLIKKKYMKFFIAKNKIFDIRNKHSWYQNNEYSLHPLKIPELYMYIGLTGSDFLSKVRWSLKISF